MVSTMESNETADRDLQRAERAAAAPWIDYKPSPWWLVPSFALLEGALVLLLGERENIHGAVFAVTAVLLVFLLFAWLGAAMSRHGVVPRLRHAPAEFVALLRAYYAGFALLVAVVVIMYVGVGSRVAAVAAAVGAAGGLYLYEWYYAKVAEAVRTRLA